MWWCNVRSVRVSVLYAVSVSKIAKIVFDLCSAPDSAEGAHNVKEPKWIVEGSSLPISYPVDASDVSFSASLAPLALRLASTLILIPTFTLLKWFPVGYAKGGITWKQIYAVYRVRPKPGLLWGAICLTLEQKHPKTWHEPEVIRKLVQ